MKTKKRPEPRPSHWHEAWDLRFNQKIEECRHLLTRIKHSLGIAPGPLDARIFDRHPEAGAEELGQLLLLSASLARADGQLETAKALVAAAEEGLDRAGHPPVFQLHFQRGLNCWLEGDFSPALEQFLTARLVTQAAREKIYALANALFCLESLGLPFEKTQKELDSLMAQTGPADEGLQGVFAQIRAFRYRFHFRTGDVRSIFAPEKGRRSEVVDQATYYRLWVSELPFHAFHDAVAPGQKEDFYLSRPYFHQKAYRLRTLQGILHPDDLASFKESEFADRLYLWTWRWLADPDRFPLQRLMALIRDVDFLDLASRLSAEDFQLVRNSLLWLCLFDPSSFQAIHRIIQGIRPPQARDYPLFELERQLQHYLFALRDRRATEAEDFLKGLRADPLWDSRDIGLASLARSESEGGRPLTALKALRAQLEPWLRPAPESARRELVIDLATSELHRSGKTIVSPAMTAAFDLLHRKGSVECGEFLLVCFGLHEYDPFIHNAKIFNLLARMRQCAPDLRLGVKTGRIYATGSWEEVEFKREQRLAGGLQGQAEWKLLLRRKTEAATSADGDRWVKPALVLKKLAGQTEVRREDLEQLTGKSRSTANRIIARWLKQGYLKKTGKARNTRYTVCLGGNK